MTKRLTELRIGEVSLVDKAANKRKFLIMKSEEGGGTMGDLIFKDVDEAVAKVLKAIAEDKKYLDVIKFSEDNADLLEAVMTGDKDAVAMVKSILSGGADTVKVMKSAFGDEMKGTESEMTLAAAMSLLTAVEGDLPEAAVEKMTKMLGLPEKKEDYGTIKKNDDGSYNLESIPEEMRTMVEGLWKSSEAQAEAIKKAEKRADDQETVLKAERNTRILKEFVQKAGEFKSLSVDADKFGAILKSASESMSKEDFEELNRVLKAADDNATNLFKEYGHSLDNENDDKTAFAKLEKAAGVIATRDGISKEVAFVKAMDEHPDLAKAELAERNSH